MNDNSIVVKVVYGETSFLFMGDAELEEEFELILIHIQETRIGLTCTTASDQKIERQSEITDCLMIEIPGWQE